MLASKAGILVEGDAKVSFRGTCQRVTIPESKLNPGVKDGKGKWGLAINERNEGYTISLAVGSMMDDGKGRGRVVLTMGQERGV